MKEIGNDKINVSKKLYYKKVAAILLVALFVFLGYSLISSMKSHNEESISNKLLWNDSYRTCEKTATNLCENNLREKTLEGLFGNNNENMQISEKKLFNSEDEKRMNLAKELEESVIMNENMLKEEEFYDL